jgi:hypothetical protein
VADAAREPGALPPLGEDLPVVRAFKPVLLLAPVAAPPQLRRAAAAAAPATPLATSVERLRLADARFRGIRVELNGATVLVRGGEARGEDVMALARALSRLSGVERVVVKDGP